ncbi:hypothetical protein Tco_0920173 [Tanacetum coccineum]
MGTQRSESPKLRWCIQGFFLQPHKEQFADRKEGNKNLLLNGCQKIISDVFIAWMMPKEIWAAIERTKDIQKTSSSSSLTTDNVAFSITRPKPLPASTTSHISGSYSSYRPLPLPNQQQTLLLVLADEVIHSFLVTYVDDVDLINKT